MLLIKNGRILDPGYLPLQQADIFIRNGKIAPLDAVPSQPGAVTILDASGYIVAPGLVDMHVHFRDPGFVYKEDLLSGARAAAAGGVTTAVCMPNTAPALDEPDIIADLIRRADGAVVNIFPFGAVTAGQKGGRLTDIPALKKAGAVALSDDGIPLMDASLMRQALKKADAEGLVISSHCEDASLVHNYAVNEGEISRQLGIPGRPAVAEELMVMRDIMLARDTGARVHIAHVSTAGSVEIIRRAKAEGVRVTAETCPQYFTLTQDAVLSQGAMARVNPPLRTETDVQAVIAGLADGTLDAIVTDHAPHAAHEKSLPLADAPSGISGLETSLGVTLTTLVRTGRLTLEHVIKLMSSNPASILGLQKGHLRIGDDADVVLFDPDERWTVDTERFRSKGHNTPFNGMTLTGRVKCTIAGGIIVYKGD